MKNSDLLLFFLIIYNIILSIIFGVYYIKNKREYKKMDKYNEELIFELAKVRRK